jgi:branched-chain amino acid transport system permease protein
MTATAERGTEVTPLPRPAWGRHLVAVAVLAVVLVPLPLVLPAAQQSVAVRVLVFAILAIGWNVMSGFGGMFSFGHAAYFGLGAYGAALFFKAGGLPMEAALLLAPLLAAFGALVFGWFCVRLSGVYLAMLTLAFAQIVWSIVFQWDALTGGSNGLVGIWPAAWLAPRPAYYLLVLACTVAGCALLVRMLHAPFGLALRASRDSPVRAAAIGIRVPHLQWIAFVVAGTVAGLAGSLFAFAKGTISPETLGVGKSVDGLVMVLLGGVQAVSGPWVGAALFTWLQDTVARQTDYWRALLGIVMLALVLLFPLGVAGGLKRIFIREPA